MESEQLNERRAVAFIGQLGVAEDSEAAGRITAAAARWHERLTSAQQAMNRSAARAGTLIEVAAQHPLIDGKFPGDEFAARLRRGHELYREAAERGPAAIYVPGSRHVFGGVEDAVSLSEAGGDFLRRLGVPASDLRGDDLNEAYLGDEGVYGSIDECYVTARYFLDGDFGRLYCVVSPFQLPRKLLHYIEFGVLPLAVTAPTVEAFHDLVDELFIGIPEALFEPDSLRARRLLHSQHEDRRPGLR